MKKVKLSTIDNIMGERLEKVGVGYFPGNSLDYLEAINNFLDNRSYIKLTNGNHFVKKADHIGLANTYYLDDTIFKVKPIELVGDLVYIGNIRIKVQYMFILSYLFDAIKEKLSIPNSITYLEIDKENGTISIYNPDEKEEYPCLYTYAAIALKDEEMLTIAIPDLNVYTCAYDMKDARYMAHDLALITLWDIIENKKEVPKSIKHTKEDYPDKTVFYVTVSSDEIQQCIDGEYDKVEAVDKFTGPASVVLDPTNRIFKEYSIGDEFDLHVKVVDINKHTHNTEVCVDYSLK